MFSQLCRARPRTLWGKFSVRASVHSDHIHAPDDIERVSSFDPTVEDTRCQLEHCSFCDYRVCCGITSNPPEESTTGNWDLKVTKNPAYGLSIQNSLEIIEDDEENRDSNFKNHLTEPEDLLKQDGILREKNSEYATSQQDCDANFDNMNQYNNTNRNSELVPSRHDPPKEKLKTDNQKTHDLKQNGVSWSVLKHRQIAAEVTEKRDKVSPNIADSGGKSSTKDSYLTENDGAENGKYQWNKEKQLSLSVVKPIARMGDKRTDHQKHTCNSLKADISRQKPILRSSRERFKNHALIEDRSESLTNVIDPLAEIGQIKTEESIQEWLARINVSGNNSTIEESGKDKNRGSAWDLRNDEAKELVNKPIANENGDETIEERRNEETKTLNESNFISFDPEVLQDVTDTTTLLCNASKISPANIPMVVMQCSRLHSHIGSKPPYQPTSLPMGTLVTGLYQESDWLYVQTPHGIEGFLSAANCASIGTINDPAPISRRPWEPCDFPIRIMKHKKEDFVRQQAAYIQTKLPVTGNKQAIPYVSTVKMKTNFYTDRYFSNTFKSRDPIKIAKTVTDILRSSPETKVSH